MSQYTRPTWFPTSRRDQDAPKLSNLPVLLSRRDKDKRLEIIFHKPCIFLSTKKTQSTRDRVGCIVTTSRTSGQSVQDSLAFICSSKINMWRIFSIYYYIAFKITPIPLILSASWFIFTCRRLTASTTSSTSASKLAHPITRRQAYSDHIGTVQSATIADGIRHSEY